MASTPLRHTPSFAEADASCTSNGCDYFGRPEVRQLLQRLKEEKPEDLQQWLHNYADQAGAFALDSECESSQDEDPYNLLDWRFFILNKEKDTLDLARRSAQTRQGALSQNVVRVLGPQLRPFVPHVIQEAILSGLISPDDSLRVLNSSYDPVISCFDSVVVFADASGFTALTHRLAQQPNGAEEIGACINRFFEPLIDIVSRFGGDILKFSGDAITILWPVVTDSPDADPQSAAASAASAACFCCLEMQDKVQTFGVTPVPDIRLTIHIGVGFGRLSVLQLGGVMDRWEYCAAGAPLEEVAIAEPLAKPGETVLGPRLREVLQDGAFLIQDFADGSAPPGFCRLLEAAGESITPMSSTGSYVQKRRLTFDNTRRSFSHRFDNESRSSGELSLDLMAKLVPKKKNGQRAQAAVTAWSSTDTQPDDKAVSFPVHTAKNGERTPTPSRPGSRRSTVVAWSERRGSTASRGFPSSPGAAACGDRCLERYVPAAVMRRLTHAGEPEAEMRRIAVIFLNIRGLDAASEDGADARKTQRLMRLFQRSCYALEGSVNKFLVDDKGMLLLAVFGLPPLNHYTDDPIRAVLTAARLCDTLAEEEVEGGAGVATGMCWCGIVGTRLSGERVKRRRCEYTVLGHVVNLSARLMANATTNSVLVDGATYRACKGLLEFDSSRGAIKVKSLSKPVPVYRFTGQLVSAAQQKQKALQSPLLSWSAWPMKTKLLCALERQLLHREGPGGLVFVEGGPGCGKTEAVEHIKAWASAKGFALVHGQNMNPTATFSVPRLCWQEVFGKMMNIVSTDPWWHNRVEVMKRLDSERKPGRRRIFSTSLGANRTSDLYQILKAMLTFAGASEDLLVWAPLLQFVIPGINFGAKGVSALLERSEQLPRSRLAMLCALLLEAFTAAGSAAPGWQSPVLSPTDREVRRPSTGTVVLVHMKRGTSFHQETYVHDQHIACEVAELCLKRRSAVKEAAGKPLIFVLVSRNDVTDSVSRIRRQADEFCEGLVTLSDLDLESTAQYMAHLLKAKTVCNHLVDHVFEVGGGSPSNVRKVTEKLQESDMLQWSEQGEVTLTPAWQDKERLKALPFPEALKGVALATFERLSFPAQMLLKAAAVCSITAAAEYGDDHDVFSVEALYSSLDPHSGVDVPMQCKELVRLNIFTEVVVEHSENGEDTSGLDGRTSSTSGSETESANEGSIRQNAVWMIGRGSLSSDSGVAGDDSPASETWSRTPVAFSDHIASFEISVVDRRVHYRFVSRLLRHVASTLVLEAQRSQMAQRSKLARKSSSVESWRIRRTGTPEAPAMSSQKAAALDEPPKQSSSSLLEPPLPAERRSSVRTSLGAVSEVAPVVDQQPLPAFSPGDSAMSPRSRRCGSGKA